MKPPDLASRGSITGRIDRGFRCRRAAGQPAPSSGSGLIFDIINNLLTFPQTDKQTKQNRYRQLSSRPPFSVSLCTFPISNHFPRSCPLAIFFFSPSFYNSTRAKDLISFPHSKSNQIANHIADSK